MPPVCPPPVIRGVNSTFYNGTLSPQPNGAFVHTMRFAVPNSTLAIVGFVNYTDWQASSVAASLAGPAGFKAWSRSESSDAFLTQPQPRERTTFEYNSYEDNNGQVPKPGEYTLTLRAQLPLSGDVRSEFGLVLACGGLLS